MKSKAVSQPSLSRDGEGRDAAAHLEFIAVGKQFEDGTWAVREFTLDVREGELMVLVGPSGCGKTTLLRLVAGLERVTEGEIRVDAKRVNELPPRQRDIAMVFQNYGLYPQMTVYDNIAFGLKMRRVPKARIKHQVGEIASVLGLDELLRRRPSQLSGGQRQRVAMARAIVRSPKVFLMDEPLSNLDASLRVQLRAEISRIQHELGTTMIFVTHDQVEAMTMGTRIAVMSAGQAQQVGSPQSVYEEPANLFVARFLGSPAMNVLRGKLEGSEEDLVVWVGKNPWRLSTRVTAARPQLRRYIGKRIVVGIRPEHLNERRPDESSGHESSWCVLPARVDFVETLGSEQLIYAAVEDAAGDPEDMTGDGTTLSAMPNRVVARFNASSGVRRDSRLNLFLRSDRLHFFDADTGAAIRA